MSQLNPSQRQAVEHNFGPALVLAGAGAGKTSVLTQRVARLLRDTDLQPSRLMVVTFTNKAAKEMKERLAKMLGWKAVKEIWAGTFHSICCRILRQEIESLNMGYSRNFVIYDPKDQEKTMDLTVRSMNLDPKDYKASQMLNLVSRFKSSGLGPESISPGQVEDAFHIRLYRNYQESLLRNNALDFDDLLSLTLRLLREQPETRERLQQRFEQVLIDEYQDTNTVQFELVKTLSERHRNIFVVGDVDQSIYSFRNANFRIILRFQEDFPDARVIKLEENYRSTGHILAAANDLIERNTERFAKTLIATRGQGEPLRFFQAHNEDEESSYIARQIQRLQEQENLSFGDFALLYRTNAQSRLYEQKLIHFGVPYHVVGGYRFYDRREIKDMLSYLQVLHNPQDSLSLKRILNVPKRGVGAKAVETLETSATFEGRGLTLWEAIQNERVRCQVPSRAQEGLQDLVQVLQRLMAERLPVSELIERLYHETGYRRDLEAEDDPKKREDRQENVMSLIQAALEFESETENKTDLGAFLEKIALFSDTDKLKDENRAVHLMTVHSAKGLEFPVVFIPAVEEGVFPHIRSLMEENPQAAVEEERRLMYVALTRAKNRLFLTYASNRRNQRASIHNRLSRFMVEISAHLNLPGELLAEVHQHQHEQKLKRMNIKTAKDLPGFQSQPAELHPMLKRVAKAAQQQPPRPEPPTRSALPERPSPARPPADEAPPWAVGPGEAQGEDMARISELKARLAARAAGQSPGRDTGPRPSGLRNRSSAAGEVTPAAPLQLAAGDRVRHPDFGVGQVQKVIQNLARVSFPTGPKTLNLAAAPLEKISERIS